MKKLVSLLLALLLISSTFAMTACGNESATEAPTESPTEAPTEAPTDENNNEKTEEDEVNNVMIFGDSYSTFDGYMPEGFVSFYSENKRIETDVTKVEETWWHLLTEECGLNLVQNNSWSGSTIGYTGYNNVDASHTNSFIYRLRNLIDEGFFEENRIDTVFVFGGTNDCWANAPLGMLKYEDITEEDLYTVRPAIVYFFRLLRETLPEAEIYCIVNTGLGIEITECFGDASAKIGFKTIYLYRIDKYYEHPTIRGMAQIKDQIAAVINKEK